MSYSLQAIYANATWAMSTHSQALGRLQDQASTGQEINRMSDNPTFASRILDLKADTRSKGQYLNAIDEAVSVLELSSSVLQSISDEVIRARASLTSVMSGIASQSGRNTLATDINNALEQIVSLANSQRLSYSLFGGANTELPPYAVERNAAGDITRVTYQGSGEERKVDVAPGVQMSSVLNGDSLFKSNETRHYEFYGATGAAMGTGTSSVRGDIMLTVGGGPGAYTLSIDGGATTVAMSGSVPPDDNLAVIHSQTGQVIYIDATRITATGTEPIRVEGTYDIFNIFINVRDVLRNGSNLPDAVMKELLTAAQNSLSNVNSNLVQGFPVIGGRIGTLSSLKESLWDTKVGAEQEVARLQDADMTRVAVDLARRQMLYEMSLAVAAKMFSLSFVNFIS
ncbi:MAG: flagellar hook-associated protein FlgL [Phycisphaerae bacterium]|nr:flagellar hook-associated protein FlgL [Phycisphaerae bacterium]